MPFKNGTSGNPIARFKSTVWTTNYQLGEYKSQASCFK